MIRFFLGKRRPTYPLIMGPLLIGFRIELHVERAHTDRQTNGINHSEEHARVIPFTASYTNSAFNNKTIQTHR
jgi:hypothetical protein